MGLRPVTPWSLKQLLVPSAVWAGARSCWKMKFDMAPQVITDGGNFTLDFNKHGPRAPPLFLQTLGLWFPNEKQHLLWSEKRTWDHWATVQSFFSLAQVRRLWRLNFFTICCIWGFQATTINISRNNCLKCFIPLKRLLSLHVRYQQLSKKIKQSHVLKYEKQTNKSDLSWTPLLRRAPGSHCHCTLHTQTWADKSSWNENTV